MGLEFGEGAGGEVGGFDLEEVAWVEVEGLEHLSVVSVGQVLEREVEEIIY